MRPWLIVPLLLAAVSVPFAASSTNTTGDGGNSDLPANGTFYGPPVRGAFRLSYDGSFWRDTTPVMLRGVPVEVWVWLETTTPAAIEDTVEITAEPAVEVANATHDVTLTRGNVTWLAFTVLVPADHQDHVRLAATFTGTRDHLDQPMVIWTNWSTIDPVSVQVTTDPAPEPRDPGHDPTIRTGYLLPVRFTASVTNHGATAVIRTLLVVVDFDREIGRATVTVKPGETRTVDVGTFRMSEDLADRTSDFGLGQTLTHATFDLIIGEEADMPLPSRLDPHLDERYAYGFDYDDGALTNVTRHWPTARAEVYGGIVARLDGYEVALGEPSWVALRLMNYGESAARAVRVDVVAYPEPRAYYGPDAYLKQTRFLTIDTGVEEVLNISFVPRVATAYSMQVTGYLESGQFYQQVPLTLATPLTLDVPGDGVHLAVLGDPVVATFDLTTTENLTGARLGVAVTSTGYWQDGVPFERFLTAEDLVAIGLPGGPVDLVAGDTTSFNVTLTPRAAGNWVLIPFVEVGDLIYTAARTGSTPGPDNFTIHSSMPYTEDQVTAFFELRVLANAMEPKLLWLPGTAIFVAFISYWSYRRGTIQ